MLNCGNVCRRSRSMSEFDDFSAGEADDTTFQVVLPPPPPPPSPDPVEMIPRAVIPQSTPGSGSGSYADPSTSIQGQVPLASSGIVVLRQRKSHASGSGVRGSFYASGTLSASASRATSPVAPDLLPPPLRTRRLTPYPVPPPSMIISPARTPIRASSSDRGAGERTFSQGDAELLRRKLEDVETKASGRSLPPEVGTGGNCPMEPVGISLAEPSPALAFRRGNDFYHSWSRPRMERPDGRGGKAEKRSMSVSPRTARRKFFDEYPYDPPKDSARPDRWKRTRGTNHDDDVTAEAAAKSRHSDVSVVESGADVTAAEKETVSSSAERKPEEEIVRRTVMLRFSTLPFFRKKSGVPRQHQLESGPLPPATVAASGSLTRSLPRLQMPRFSTASCCEASRGHRPGQTGVKPEPGSRGKDEKENDFQEPTKRSKDLKKSKLVDPKDQDLLEWEKKKESAVSRDPDKIRDSDRRSRESTRFGFGLRKVVPPPTSSTQSLDQLNSTKFQRIIKPFRKLGAAPAGGDGRDDRRAAGGGMSSKQNSRVLFPAFYSLSESTIRSISLSSDLLKELNVGHGHSRASVKSDDDDDLVDDQTNATVVYNRSSSSSHSIKIPDDPVQFRSLDRKSKKFY